MIILAVIALVIGVGVWYKTNGEKSQVIKLPYIDLTTAKVNNEKINNTNMNPLAEENLKFDENATVVLHTNRGDIEIELFLTETPVTAGNFLSLSEKGFYDAVKFHRVIEGFMIQGGDPNSKEDDESMYGRGGPGYAIPDEFAPGLSNVVGTISMANSGPNSGGSQFFINTNDNVFLDGKHAVFGKVVSGMEVVTAIETTETKPGDVPVEPVVIESIEIKSEE